MATSEASSEFSGPNHRGAAIETGLEKRVKIPSMLRHGHTFTQGRFLAPVFVFNHEDDARHALVTYRDQIISNQKHITRFLAVGPLDKYGQDDIQAVRHQRSGFNLVLEVPRAQSTQAEKYQMSALGTLMLFNVNGVVDPGLAPRGVDMDLECDSTFMHPVLDGVYVHTYRRTDHPDGPVGVVIFDPDAPEFTSFTAGLVPGGRTAANVIADVVFSQMPSTLEEPALVSVRPPNVPESKELIETLAPSVAQVSFMRMAWHEGAFSTA